MSFEGYIRECLEKKGVHNFSVRSEIVGDQLVMHIRPMPFVEMDAKFEVVGDTILPKGD